MASAPLKEGLSPKQSGALAALLHALPDPLLMRLNAALASAKKGDPLFAPVSDLATHECRDRSARDLVFAPLKPLSDPAITAPRAPLLKRQELAAAWDLLRREAPEELAAAAPGARTGQKEEESVAGYDALCLKAAALLEAAAAPRPAPLAAKLLRMAPVLRRTTPRLGGWMRNLNADAAAAVRISYRDAGEISEELGPLFIEALFVHLEEPCHVLRLISAVVAEQPSDRYLAASELASFGERLLKDLDGKIAELSTFNPAGGAASGGAAAEAVREAVHVIREFEERLKLTRDGPWGGRIHAARTKLLGFVEERLRACEPALAQALPQSAHRAPGSHAPRLSPKIDGYPNDALVRRCEGLLAFLEESKASAAIAGFGALRSKVQESVSASIDGYVGELMDRIKEGREGEGEWVRAHLEAAADLCAAAGAKDRAQVIRRRAASAA